MLPISVCRFARRRSCPGVSPQRFDSPWHALVAASCISLASVQARKLVHSAAAPLPTKSPILREPCCRSWHTSPGDHIPAGRLFNCQGACPSLVWTGEGVLGGCFSKNVFIPSLVPTGIGEMHTPSAEKFLSDNKKTAGKSFVYRNFRLKQYFEIFFRIGRKTGENLL